MILGLQDEERVVQTETKKMVGIASEYQKSLQSKPPMNLPRERVINE